MNDTPSALRPSQQKQYTAQQEVHLHNMTTQGLISGLRRGCQASQSAGLEEGTCAPLELEGPLPKIWGGVGGANDSPQLSFEKRVRRNRGLPDHPQPGLLLEGGCLRTSDVYESRMP